MKIFDYAFYSLYTLYLRKEKKGSNYIYNTTLAISILQLLMFFGIAIISDSLIDEHFSFHEFLGVSEKIGKVIFIFLLFVWNYLNYKSYKKRLPKILKKYRNHPRNKWFRAWMLYFVALGFILIPIFIIKILKAFS
jgi:hypothetical protein